MRHLFAEGKTNNEENVDKYRGVKHASLENLVLIEDNLVDS